VLIGAANDDTGAANAGAAYLFSTNGVLLTTFTNPTPASGDLFGASVAALGSDRVLIGAERDNTGATQAGAAYLFSPNGTLLTTFTNPTPTTSDLFGKAVAAVGNDRILIGADSADTGAANAGAAYLFSTNGTLLTTFTNPTPAEDDEFGTSVAAVGSDRVLVSAQFDDTGAPIAGAAYLFSLDTYAPGLVAESVQPRSITTAALEDGAVTAAKIGGVLFVSQIPDLDASKITTGTLADARLSTNVALLDRSPQTFAGVNFFQNSVGIGTASPGAYPLRVNGNVRLGNRLTGGRSGAQYDEMGYNLGFTSTNDLYTYLDGDAAASIRLGNSGDIEFRTAPVGSAGTSLTLSNRLIIKQTGNVGIGTNAPQQKLHVVGNILATGTITPNSDRNMKTDFATVDTAAVLEKVVKLSIQQWRFKAEDTEVKHFGPMAQDFRAAFGLGEIPTAIATVDADGVALAAIQGLNQKLEQKAEQKETEIAELKARLEKLERLMNQNHGGAK
jgi:hypothetical protein